jgi:hypothetical protein
MADRYRDYDRDRGFDRDRDRDRFNEPGQGERYTWNRGAEDRDEEGRQGYRGSGYLGGDFSSDRGRPSSGSLRSDYDAGMNPNRDENYDRPSSGWRQSGGYGEGSGDSYGFGTRSGYGSSGSTGYGRQMSDDSSSGYGTRSGYGTGLEYGSGGGRPHERAGSSWETENRPGSSRTGSGSYGSGSFGSGSTGYGRQTTGNIGTSGFAGVGTGGSLTNSSMGSQRQSYRGRGPKGFQRTDERIRELVSERLEEHDEIDASDIEVTVTSGVVTLSGTVDHRHTKRLAEDVAESVTGVNDVFNNIKVNRGFFGRVADEIREKLSTPSSSDVAIATGSTPGDQASAGIGRDAGRTKRS